MSNILTLTSNSRTTHGKKTTEKEPEYTTREEQTINGFYNPDGTTNDAAQAEFERGKNNLATAYNIDPETGRVNHKYLSNVIGFDPELTRKRREDEEALNRRKQKESALYNSLAVLGDMITTAGGGNVWQRKADQHAKTAHDENLLLQKEQQAEDAAVANKVAGQERTYADAVQKLRDSVAKAYGTKVVKTTKTGGKSVTTQEDDKTSATRQVLDNSGYGGGKGNGAEVYINVKMKDGSQKRYSVSPAQYKAATNLLRAHYDDILHRGAADNATAQEKKAAENLRRDLVRVGALEQEVDDATGKIQYKIKDDMLLQNGEFFQLTPALRTRLEDEVGGQIKFTTGQRKQGGWGEVTQQSDEYDF